MLKDKVFVVTGGAGAIGQSFARGVSDRGGIAIVADITQKQQNCLRKIVQVMRMRRIQTLRVKSQSWL